MATMEIRTTHQDIVGAHGHKVDAYRVVLAHGVCNLQLGAHAIRTRHEDGVVEPSRHQVKEACGRRQHIKWGQCE